MHEYDRLLKLKKTKGEAKPIEIDRTKISWSRTLDYIFKKDKNISFSKTRIFTSLYRPFIPQYCYFQKDLNAMLYQLPQLFPDKGAENRVICINQNVKSDIEQIALMSNRLPDLHFNGDSQCFPRWIYKDDQEQVDLFQAKTENRIDALSPESIEHFRWTYPGETVTSEDVFYYIYGILHSEDYRLAYLKNFLEFLGWLRIMTS
jgi:predicted helicase